VTNKPDMMDQFIALFNKDQLKLFYGLLPEQDFITKANENLLTKQMFLVFLQSFVTRVVSDKTNADQINRFELFEEQVKFLLEQYRQLPVLTGSEEEKKELEASLKDRSLAALEELKAKVLKNSEIKNVFQSVDLTVLRKEVNKLPQQSEVQNEQIAQYKSMI